MVLAGCRSNLYSPMRRNRRTGRATIAAGTAALSSFLTLIVIFSLPHAAYAEGGRATAKRTRPDANAGMFGERFDVTGFFDSKQQPQPVKPAPVVEPARVAVASSLPAPGAPAQQAQAAPQAPAQTAQLQAPPQAPAAAPVVRQPQAAAIEAQQQLELREDLLPKLDLRKLLKPPVYVSDQPPTSFPAPNTDPQVRINPDAPVPAIAMIVANQNGDKQLALAYAKQLLRYQENFFYEVRQLTELLGQAMIDQNIIEDDDWTGVEQFIEYEFAKNRQEEGAMLKPTHDKSMERIKPDPKGEAEIYYFFTMQCSWCRKMAPDVERLHRVVSKDKKLKMVALMLNKTPRIYVDEYRKYTGLTLPIFEGSKQAKAFGVGFAPALIVVSPNNRVAYLKTGQQNFERMYEFVRKVQGLPNTLTPELAEMISEPIGEVEQLSPRPLRSRALAGRASRTSGSVMMPVRAKANAESIVGRF